MAKQAKHGYDRRWCYYLDEAMYEDGRGFRPVVVFEGEAGYRQQGGDPDDVMQPAPWYWGHDFEAAKDICQTKNGSMGLTPDDVSEIIASSFRAPVA